MRSIEEIAMHQKVALAMGWTQQDGAAWYDHNGDWQGCLDVEVSLGHMFDWLHGKGILTIVSQTGFVKASLTPKSRFVGQRQDGVSFPRLVAEFVAEDLITALQNLILLVQKVMV